MEGVVLNLGEVIIGSLIFITTTLWGIFQYFQSQRHSIQVEKLKYSLEIQRNQGILNDEKYRLAYEDFINVFVSMLKDIKLNETAEKKKKKFEGYVERMYNFIETSLLFS